MSTSSFLLIKGTGDGRPNLHSEHIQVDALVSGTLGDLLVMDTSTAQTRLKQRSGSVNHGFGYIGSYTNMPLALQEIANDSSRRRLVSLRGFTQFRILVTVGSVASTAGVIGAQYSTDSGANWNGLDNGTAATESTATAAITPADGVTASSWATINAAARIDDILLRLTSSGGDGAEDPVVGLLYLEVR